MDKDPECYNILKQIYLELNKANGNSKGIEAKESLKKKESRNTGKKLNKEEANKIMDNLIQKIVKKNPLENPDNKMLIDDPNLNNAGKGLYNTKVFQNLMNKYENKIEKTLIERQSGEVKEMEDDLPHFGGSSSKKEASPYEMYKNEEIPNFHNQNSNIQNQKGPPHNPNNTMTKFESQINEDSIFGEAEDETKIKMMNKFTPSDQLDNIVKSNINENIFAMINSNQEDNSSFFQNSQSIILQHDDSNILVDEYVDDDDPGFDLYECEIEFFKTTCKKLSDQYDFPRRAICKSKFKNNENLNKENEKNMITNDPMKSIKTKEEIQKKNSKGELMFEIEGNKDANIAQRKSLLPNDAKFMQSGDLYYPLQYNNVIYDCFNLKVIVDRERTGFEESKEFKIVINSLIAGRFQVVEFLGSAAFSKALKCLDIVENKLVCLKVIENNKDYVDQSIDEIKLLRYINANGLADEKNFLKLFDYFYHKEHLFIVTELLKDNLYDFYKYLNENNVENYFSLTRLQKITKQILGCIEFLHSLKLIHCDLKPENILMRSISDCAVKVIDFGSSCFIHDHLSSYVQSRSYRAPEVIIGCKYDYKIDMWSLGCILAELYTGNVLFQNDSIQSLLARVIFILIF